MDFDLEDIQPKERRQVLQTVNRKIRDARFRASVLRAYSHRCCVCGIQLDLLDAAHIIPVEHERGTDEIKNGLSLCALHHRAFDHALITVRTDYSIGCSEKEFQATYARSAGMVANPNSRQHCETKFYCLRKKQFILHQTIWNLAKNFVVGEISGTKLWQDKSEYQERIWDLLLWQIFVRAVFG